MEIPFKHFATWEERMQALAHRLLPNSQASCEAHPWHGCIGSFEMVLTTAHAGCATRTKLYVDYGQPGWQFLIPGESDEEEDYVSKVYSHPFEALEGYLTELNSKMVTKLIITTANEDQEAGIVNKNDIAF